MPFFPTTRFRKTGVMTVSAGVAPGITLLPLVSASESAGKSIYVHAAQARTNAGGSGTLDQATQLFEIGLCPDQTLFPGKARSCWYFTNFNAFNTSFLDPSWTPGSLWPDRSIFAYMRWQGPAIPTLRWYCRFVLSVSILERDPGTVETQPSMPLITMVTYPPPVTAQYA